MSEYYNSILVPIDFTKRSELQILQAYYVAKIFNKPVTIMHVVHSIKSMIFQGGKVEKRYEDASRSLEERLRRIASFYQNKFKHEFLPNWASGSVKDVIVDFAKKEDIQLIVIGKSGHSSVFQNSIGKHAFQILYSSPSPVLVIDQIVKQTFRKILLPLDLKKPVQNKLLAAMLFSRQYGAPLKIIHIVTPEYRSNVQEYEEKLLQIKNYLTDYNIASSYELVYDFDYPSKIPQKIVDYAKYNECDLIMMMTQQEFDFKDMFIGSTASGVIRYSKIPVLSITPSFSLVQIL
ncbi:MAG: universal stress protein [Bacteroidales bacterium]|nr:universal stress protein [Bacteroidales bacterium]